MASSSTLGRAGGLRRVPVEADCAGRASSGRGSGRRGCGGGARRRAASRRSGRCGRRGTRVARRGGLRTRWRAPCTRRRLQVRCLTREGLALRRRQKSRRVRPRSRTSESPSRTAGRISAVQASRRASLAVIRVPSPRVPTPAPVARPRVRKNPHLRHRRGAADGFGTQERSGRTGTGSRRPADGATSRGSPGRGEAGTPGRDDGGDVRLGLTDGGSHERDQQAVRRDRKAAGP